MDDIKCPFCSSPSYTKNGYRRHSDGSRVQTYRCAQCSKMFSDTTLNDDVIVETVRQAKRAQKFQDSNRIERKAFREYARVENAVAEYNKELIKLLEGHNFSKFTVAHNKEDRKACGIIQLSDLHFNELVNLTFNKSDFTIAAQRLRMLACNAKRFFKAFRINNLLIAFTGDILNSDRRLDELLNSATNRAMATFIGVDLLKAFILDINQNYNVQLACITGNESRAKDVYSKADLIASDNYDFTIFNMLRYLFKGGKIDFHVGDDPTEQVINVAGKNFLILHGDQRNLTGGDLQKGVLQLTGKYSNRGVRVDFVLFGHLHYSQIGDQFARSASLVGANDYSDKDLHLHSLAAQNLHIVTENGQIHNIKVDLQDASHYRGYNFDNKLEAYHPKSASKLKKRKVTFEVVI